MDKSIFIKYAILFLLIVTSFTVNGQFSVDIGNDTSYCKDLYAEPVSYLGPNIKIENGTEPYEFSWECKYQFSESSPVYGASAFLNDTSIQNPYFIDYPVDAAWLKLVLTVKDAVEQEARDSIQVRFSWFGYTYGYYAIPVLENDSIRFYGDAFIGAGIPPLEYSWEPEDYLSDPTSLSTWCKPLSDIDYYLTATDSVGCVSEPTLMYSLTVVPTDIESHQNGSKHKLYQVNEFVYFENPTGEQVKIAVYSLSGRLVMQKLEAVSRFNTMDLGSYNGMYLIKIETKEKIQSGLFYKY